MLSLPRGGILAFDSARRVGWAHALPGEEPTWGGVIVAPERGHPGEWIVPMFKYVMRALDQHRPMVVGFMRPIRTKFDTTDRLEKLFGLTSQIRCACGLRGEQDLIGLRVHAVEDAEVCKAFTGKGRWGGRPRKKAAVIDVCRRYGWNVRGDDDAADALALLVFLETRLYPVEAAKRGTDKPFFHAAARR